MRARPGTHKRRTTQPGLSERQVEVLRLIERGHTNGQIASELGITLDGAKFHVAEIMAVLQVNSREDAVKAWRNGSRRPAGWLPFAGLGRVVLASIAGGTFAVAAIVVTLAVLSRDDGTVFGPPAGPSDTSLAACPAVPPAIPMQTVIDWVPFVQFNGTMYLASTEKARVLPGSPFGRVQRMVAETNVGPAHFEDCDSTSLGEGTVLYAVEGFDPRFRIATLDGHLYQASASFTAKAGADFLDLEGKTVRVTVTWRGEIEMRSGNITDPASLRLIENAILAAPYDRRANIPDDGYDISLTFADGSGWVAGLSSKTGYVRGGLLLPPDIVALLIEVAPAPE